MWKNIEKCLITNRLRCAFFSFPLLILLLSFHIARHSFACFALANKVSMETIAKMLGHSDIRTTKIYTKVLDTTVSKEMETMKNKFAI
ncbi:hypothetical protein E1I98_08400 [Phocaeicola dorei]|uniref:Tyr recombinase domain-containing protein n=1 Tax=Phocaeicola dorei TaxID=357276 RepID=A0A4R4GJU6_9BACT|nr:hypothetical protein E1I98_08400 [Phocaeicola dorei]